MRNVFVGVSSITVTFGLITLMAALLLLQLTECKEWTDEELAAIEKQWAEHDGEEDEISKLKRLQLEKDEKAKKEKESLANLDFSKFGEDGFSPDDILKMSKRGKPLMVFVQVLSSMKPHETDQLTEIWHHGLKNGGIDVQRYAVGDNRFIFMFSEGSEAFTAKEFFMQQKELYSIEIDSQLTPGQAHPDYGSTNTKKPKSEL